MRCELVGVRGPLLEDVLQREQALKFQNAKPGQIALSSRQPTDQDVELSTSAFIPMIPTIVTMD